MSDLLKINVNEHTEKKGKLTYLSWSWAWAEVLKLDPDAEWSCVEYVYRDEANAQGTVPYMLLSDRTAMVKTLVTIKGKTKTSVLPVMDHNNKAIKDPNAFQVNTAIMRCMTKAISMHGLGLYIYAGEDLPEGEEKHEDRAGEDELPEFDAKDPFSLFTPAQAKKVRAVAQACLQAFNEGNEWTAYEEYTLFLERASSDDMRTNIQLALSIIFKPHSALRSCLKKLAEEQRNKETA